MEFHRFKLVITNALKPMVDRITRKIVKDRSTAESPNSFKHTSTTDDSEANEAMMTHLGSRFGTRIRY